ncbi:helix-turn-helix domain-containing protein [Schleiferilactobacillus harbinensis]|uniref:helix-turn-helix domain-containing protein n=1 Tax=Schleiferilactobacillus harbinensis TaxID=304207 RepID=UPI0039EB9D43
MKEDEIMRKPKNCWIKDNDQLDVAMIMAGIPTRRELAKKAGLGYSVLTHLGVLPVSTLTAAKISKAVNCTVDEMFEKTAQK